MFTGRHRCGIIMPLQVKQKLNAKSTMISAESKPETARSPQPAISAESKPEYKSPKPAISAESKPETARSPKPAISAESKPETGVQNQQLAQNPNQNTGVPNQQSAQNPNQKQESQTSN